MKFTKGDHFIFVINNICIKCLVTISIVNMITKLYMMAKKLSVSLLFFSATKVGITEEALQIPFANTQRSHDILLNCVPMEFCIVESPALVSVQSPLGARKRSALTSN